MPRNSFMSVENRWTLASLVSVPESRCEIPTSLLFEANFDISMIWQAFRIVREMVSSRGFIDCSQTSDQQAVPHRSVVKSHRIDLFQELETI